MASQDHTQRDEELADVEDLDIEPPTQQQPERDDRLDPDAVEAAVEDEPTVDAVVGDLPTTEELPESQGADPMDAERLTEDATPRRRLSDEELEGGAGADDA